ncbi:hypothetical protein [Colwellia psychrerythraea]|uniref:Uncharacterized protein n=1 Tax=Colwellia psychrerythraea TaxID=28229 RepID=A0A099K9M9_COLPS|nr:hypothetical protein [Colwellia psychrerythraea]KGJ87434.1 hypothetical protein GAB14E_4589 [Colwellia psychrerythraea]
MKTIDKYLVTSLIIWLVALIESIGGLCGFWSITGKERITILFIESAILIALLGNCYAIKNWLYRHSTEVSHRLIAWLVLAALILCICGDIVNFNLPLTYHRYGGVVKHDYLADSVFFFAPGYALFLVAACWISLVNGLKPKVLVVIMIIACLVGAASFFSMHLPGTGLYVSMITGSYAVLITLVGASALLLLMVLGKSSAKLTVWLIASGLILAMVADAVIGQFWIYGNNGQGYFPVAKYVNWVLYIGSQCLLIHLARLAVFLKSDRNIVVDKAVLKSVD